MKRYETVDAFLEEVDPVWSNALYNLRGILNTSGLEETVKWGAPTYTYKGKNVAGIGAFKSYVGIWFYQGALLSDPAEKLINAQEGKTNAMRQWRFENGSDINESLIHEYINEAISNIESGIEIKPKRNKELVIVAELKSAFNNNKELSSNFEKLPLSKKREYAEYIADAKREATKAKRMEKIIPMILEGIGLNDKYRNC